MSQFVRAAIVVGVVAAAGAVPASAQPMPSTHKATAAASLVGQLVPTFGWPAMDDSTAIISPLSLEGSVVLLDLWGTWCGPCRREMPFLHDAYTTFHAQGFEIVSVAFDTSPGKVAAFRREHFPMPWQHVYANAAIEAEATRIFHVDSFPRALLIDRDGTVLRVDTGLRGPALVATLDSLFSGRVLLRR